ncbi:MAG: YdcF family protein [Acidobacteriota bacterium]|nr:YdcF family protein [Acidobacteriota bacterium]
MVVLFAILYERSLYCSIRASAVKDAARPAGAIVVMGAAEYDGVPSPVYRGRLDHAIALDERGFASLIITTGGSGGDRRYTEGGVGRDYLIQQGIAAGSIIAETHSQTTFESVRAVSDILRRHGVAACVAVSDGFHLYRVVAMFKARGITAYGSPVPNSSIEDDPYLRVVYSLREVAALTLWRMHIHV